MTIRPSGPIVIRAVVRSQMSIRSDITMRKAREAGERCGSTEDRRQWGTGSIERRQKTGQHSWLYGGVNKERRS